MSLRRQPPCAPREGVGSGEAPGRAGGPGGRAPPFCRPSPRSPLTDGRPNPSKSRAAALVRMLLSVGAPSKRLFGFRRLASCPGPWQPSPPADKPRGCRGAPRPAPRRPWRRSRYERGCLVPLREAGWCWRF